jgi:hypothetical protein
MSFQTLSKLSLISLLIISPSVFAEAAFDGVNAQLGIGFANLGSENNWPGYGNYKYGEKGTLGNISLGYSQKIENQFNIAANIFYAFGSDKSGGRPDDHNTIYKTNDIWGIVFEPGYYFSDSSLGFLKLGYARASSEFIDSRSRSDYGSSDGFLYGLGFKQNIQDHLYIGAETYQIDFSRSDGIYNSYYTSNTSNKPSITYGGISLGYNFGSKHNAEAGKSDHPGRFNGINTQFGLGFSEKSSRSDWPSSGVSDRYDVSDKGILSNLSLGYSHNLNNRFNIAANVFYNFGSEDAGQWLTESYKWKIKDIWGVSLEPGYYLNDNGLGYLKIGYARASSEYQHNGGNADYGTTDGFLYGIGFKQLLTNAIYVGIETYQIDFSKSKTVLSEGGYDTNNRPAVTYGGLMIGYRF